MEFFFVKKNALDRVRNLQGNITVPVKGSLDWTVVITKEEALRLVEAAYDHRHKIGLLVAEDPSQEHVIYLSNKTGYYVKV